LPGGWIRRQLCEPLSALFQAAVHLLPTISHLLLQALFTESSQKELPLFPSPVCSEHSSHSTACPFQFLVYYSLLILFVCLFVLQGEGQSVQGAMLVYPRDGCGNMVYHLFAYLLVCISQAGLELASGGAGALQVSQCNVAWRNQFSVLEFCLLLVVFSASCSSRVSARFLIYGSHAVCFLPLVAILDLH
jgi:hypothetical protein